MNHNPDSADSTESPGLAFTYTDPPPRSPFTQDFVGGFIVLVKEAVKKTVRERSKYRDYWNFRLHPPPAISYAANCSCGDQTIDGPGEQHMWHTCPNINYLFDVHQSATIKPCPHGLAPSHDDFSDHWFCFQPRQSAEAYVDWLTEQPRAKLQDLQPHKAQRVLHVLSRYDGVKGDVETPEGPKPLSELEMQVNTLYGLIAMLQRPEREPSHYRHDAWILEVQMRRILRWEDETFEHCLAHMLRAMTMMKLVRLEKPVEPYFMYLAVAAAENGDDDQTYNGQAEAAQPSGSQTGTGLANSAPTDTGQGG